MNVLFIWTTMNDRLNSAENAPWVYCALPMCESRYAAQ
jgi:hypothetical protein